ncbi:Hsp70 family protein [Vibrio sp. SS-MA-C1-2]|uniref:Hsp70 family protein n=1 Tax=Vibrio sp. SS-MA-C1-2 TaxID=2908646 RepID=UPI001F2BC2DD|nr:Hsp70 family protein [Vibrio sp. SS-MA-C1-2]UJF18161.1 Hsp70 family protein [Vibrio sp. SS-MA-C1-2]
MTKYCGLDFGTSNSTIGSFLNNSNATSQFSLIPVEEGKNTLPSAIFYSFEDGEQFFGREAINEYTEGEFGRLLRSLKSVLGTPLMHEKTQIRGQLLPFTAIIESFLSELKTRAEKQSGHQFNQVVLGRPVYFVDGNQEADKSAELALVTAAKAAGFDQVQLQFEPIAAALDYENTINKEEIAMIIDLGGGTSDFSIVRISPERSKLDDRKSDILANDGIHIGGTDFDKQLSLNAILPDFGYKSQLISDSGKLPKSGLFGLSEEDKFVKTIEMPSKYFIDLATWHRIHFLYEPKIANEIKALLLKTTDRKQLDRLLKLINQKDGHRLALDVEALKFNLTNNVQANLSLNYIEQGFQTNIKREQFESAINRDLNEIKNKILETIQQAGLKKNNITKVFMTGGSTFIPVINQLVHQIFPDIEIVSGDKFGSVGLGLALDAHRKFQ